ncbi:hypothetical protein [Polyangium sorediatum]|uniref:Lipoprotein n=1 Tax=Polyangium sorediatum TaxID=889274 RepID=A0ABT6NMV2_9BACT|nr:hypothetical protein [Polyangium sorediatum]MDI1429659.1 hypothetical protein [Polyangium sorediatum]
MKNTSKLVALILSASACVWMTGCAAEYGDLSEDTDDAAANLEKGAITKGHLGGQAEFQGISKGHLGGQAEFPAISKGKGMVGQDSQFEGRMLGKAARVVAGGTQIEQPAFGGSLEGGQAAREERVEEGQRAGIEGQLSETALVHEESAGQDVAGQVEEGDTSESQEALSSWCGAGIGFAGFGVGWRGYYPGFGGGGCYRPCGGYGIWGGYAGCGLAGAFW